MNHSPKGLSRSRRGRALRFALVAVAALAVLGFAAYRFLANRPGEAATALIPADADVVITLDTNPSQRQLAAFLKITAALEKQGIAKKLDEMFSQALEGKPIAAEIQPHLQKSFAVAMWMDDGKPMETVTLLSVDDPNAVKASLAAHGQKSSHGNYGIPGTNNAVFAMVVDAYLVLANSEATLARIERVRSGGEGSVLKLAAFNAARAALPVDANGMVFVSPRAFERLSKTPGGEALKATSWMAYSATVVPEGIQVDYQCPIDPAKMRALLRVPSIAPFDLGTLKLLPDGAYGVAAYSQVGLYWASANESLAKEPAIRDGFKDALSNFEKETGIGVARDLVPALTGEQVLAIYPGDSGKLEDVDGLLVLTDGSGANPAALATKVRALIERKTAESGKGMKFVETKVGNATVWELDAASRKRIGEAGGMLGDLGQPPSPEFGQRQDQPMPGKPEPPAFLANKSLLFAQIGNSVLVTSSRGLVQRAIGAPQSGKNLYEEPVFASATNHLIAGSQGVLLVNLRRIMLAVEPTLTEAMQGAPFQASDLTGLFGDGLTPLVASGKFDGKLGSGRLLLPFDFEKAITLIGASMNGVQKVR